MCEQFFESGRRKKKNWWWRIDTKEEKKRIKFCKILTRRKEINEEFINDQTEEEHMKR